MGLVLLGSVETELRSDSILSPKHIRMVGSASGSRGPPRSPYRSHLRRSPEISATSSEPGVEGALMFQLVSCFQIFHRILCRALQATDVTDHKALHQMSLMEYFS